jgi:hypothetical protein
MLLGDDVPADRQAAPAPSPVGLVVKNGWNSFSLNSDPMSVPLSRTRISVLSQFEL